MEDCFAVSKFMIRLLGHDKNVPREDDGAVRFDKIMDEFKAKFDGTSRWPVNAWITFLAKGGGPKKRFQYCLNPNSSKHFLYYRAIQGHSGGNVVDPAMQDNILLPDDFTEYIHHIGYVSEMYSITRSGLIPGGRSLKRNRRVFHCDEPDGRRSKCGRSSIRLGQTKDRTIKKKLGDLIKTQCIGAI